MTVGAAIPAAAFARRLAAAGVVLRIEGRFLVARGPFGALLRAFAELRARREELLVYLRRSRRETAA